MTFPEQDPHLQTQLRVVMGQYPTGVSVITALSRDNEALGMVVGTFSRVSSDPPLVSFMPKRTSNAWRLLRESGDRFCVNILSEHQEEVGQQIASRHEHRFDGIPYSSSGSGLPVIHGALAYIDCAVDRIIEAGDHDIVIGRVEEMQAMSAAHPLVFFRGGYGRFEPTTMLSRDQAIRERLQLVTQCRTEMERLSSAGGNEVSALIRDDGEIVLAAAVGRTPAGQEPIRVGQRLPFSPPFGSLDAALGTPDIQESWLDNSHTSTLSRSENEAVLDKVRSQGYAIAFGHAAHHQIKEAAVDWGKRDPSTRVELLDRLKFFDLTYNHQPHTSGSVELRLITAPVYDAAGNLAFGLTLWGPPRMLTQDELHHYIDVTLDSAARCTRILQGSLSSIS